MPYTEPARQHGFTLLEVLLSIGLISIICGTTIVLYYTVQVKNNVDIAAITTAQTIRRAQQLAGATTNDAPGWGVYVQSGSITLFQGATYATRNQSMDEVDNFAANVVPSGLTEIDFVKFTGAPTTSGTLTLTANNMSRTVIVNSKGAVTL